VAILGLLLASVVVSMGWRHHQKRDPLRNLPPAIFQSANASDTLPLPRR